MVFLGFSRYTQRASGFFYGRIQHADRKLQKYFSSFYNLRSAICLLHYPFPYLVPHFRNTLDLKEAIKKILKALPFDFTKNQRYDRLTRQVIQELCRAGSNCVDVGCHKGEILDLFLKYAPNGSHKGFEPIPAMFQNLQQRYADNANCEFFEIALSNKKGSSSFNYVVSNPSYSGLLKRRYDRPNEEDQEITVRTEKLDDVLPPDYRVDMIKIDVEGGEQLVLEGALETLKRYKPVIIFEHGLGASELYNATPEKVFEILESCGLKVSLLDRFLTKKPAFSRDEFAEQYYKKLNYYFIAY